MIVVRTPVDERGTDSGKGFQQEQHQCVSSCHPRKWLMLVQCSCGNSYWTAEDGTVALRGKTTIFVLEMVTWTKNVPAREGEVEEAHTEAAKELWTDRQTDDSSRRTYVEWVLRRNSSLALSERGAWACLTSSQSHYTQNPALSSENPSTYNKMKEAMRCEDYFWGAMVHKQSWVASSRQKLRAVIPHAAAFHVKISTGRRIDARARDLRTDGRS